MTTQELYITTDGNNWDLYQTFDEYHECTSTQFCTGSGSNYTKTFNPPLEDILGIQILTTSSSSWVSWFELEIWSYVNTYCEYVLEGECDCDGNVLDCAGVCGGSSVIDECGECGGNGIDEGECDLAKIIMKSEEIVLLMGNNFNYFPNKLFHSISSKPNSDTKVIYFNYIFTDKFSTFINKALKRVQ